MNLGRAGHALGVRSYLLYYAVHYNQRTLLRLPVPAAVTRILLSLIFATCRPKFGIATVNGVCM